MAIAIVAAGCITPIGLSLAETAAAARARVARLQEIEWRDRRFEPFIVGVVPDDGLPELAPELAEAPLQYREARRGNSRRARGRSGIRGWSGPPRRPDQQPPGRRVAGQCRTRSRPG
jgi:hypothetical protein